LLLSFHCTVSSVEKLAAALKLAIILLTLKSVKTHQDNSPQILC
jgi:hypothetical protein